MSQASAVRAAPPGLHATNCCSAAHACTFGSHAHSRRENRIRTYLSDGRRVSIPLLQVEREDAANEIRLLASIQHPNVIGYHEAFLDGNRLCIIMEFAPDGDIAKIIKCVIASPGQRLPLHIVFYRPAVVMHLCA